MDEILAYVMYRLGNNKLLVNLFPNITDKTTNLCQSYSARCYVLNMALYYGLSEAESWDCYNS